MIRNGFYVLYAKSIYLINGQELIAVSYNHLPLTLVSRRGTEDKNFLFCQHQEFNMISAVKGIMPNQGLQIVYSLHFNRRGKFSWIIWLLSNKLNLTSTNVFYFIFFSKSLFSSFVDDRQSNDSELFRSMSVSNYKYLLYIVSSKQTNHNLWREYFIGGWRSMSSTIP